MRPKIGLVLQSQTSSCFRSWSSKRAMQKANWPWRYTDTPGVRVWPSNCLPRSLFELERFKNAFSFAAVWAADFLLPLPKAHKVKQCWSGLRAPCLSNPLTSCMLCKCRCRAFIFSTLQVVLYNLIRRALQPWGRQAFEPPLVTKK